MKLRFGIVAYAATGLARTDINLRISLLLNMRIGIISNNEQVNQAYLQEDMAFRRNANIDYYF